MERQATTSVTNLVKQIADERIEASTYQIKKELKSYIDERLPETLPEIGNKFCEDLKSEMENSCKLWSEKEQELLKQELRTAFAFIAKQHGRSMNAIVCRINDKELLREVRQ